MKNLFSGLVLLCGLISHAQIVYENGYFILNDGSRTNCLIENVDWKENPVYFMYKMQPTDKPEKIGIDKVQEFGIDNVSQYKRFTVDIERSGNDPDARMLSKVKNPVFNTETLFLKTVVTGEANLHVYSNDNLTKYFYNTKGKKPEQLVHIKYLDEFESNILENNQFRQQLLNSLNCAGITENDFKKLTYKKADLSRVFVKFNQCNGSHNEVVNFAEKEKYDAFDLRIQVGIAQAKLSVSDPDNFYNVSTDFSGTVLKFGFEAEYILPFNKGIWSLFIAPLYQSFKTENTFQKTDGFNPLPQLLTHTAKVNYTGVEVPLGLRRYFYVGKQSRLFANFIYSRNFDATSKGEVAFTNAQNEPSATKTLPLAARSNVAIGLGYTYKNLGIEFRFNAPR